MNTYYIYRKLINNNIMKKIILSVLAVFALVATATAQRSLFVTTVSIDGADPIPYDDDAAEELGLDPTDPAVVTFIETIRQDPANPDFGEVMIGIPYVFNFDYVNQPAMTDDTDGVTQIPNRVRVATLNRGFGGVETFDSTDEISGNGSTSVTVTFTQEVNESDDPDTARAERGILQFRTFESFGGLDNDTDDGSDSIFIFNTNVVPGSTASVSNFSKNELSIAYDSVSDEVTLPSSADYSVFNIAGSVVAEGSSSTISLAGLVDGVYIVATENGTAKVIKY